jgi:DNA repair protein RecO (recombination protein O)
VRWQDQGIILHTRPHGERQHITTLLTRDHGRHRGVARLSRATSGMFHSGSCVKALWNARLEEHLGTWTLEPIFSPLGFILKDPCALHAITALSCLLEDLLPEREPAPLVYEALAHLMLCFETPRWLEAYCAFEVSLLAHTGIRLDLTQCAATGITENLVYVSPRSGRAVCQEAGIPYHAKLLPLPAFLKAAPAEQNAPTPQEILAALTLTGYFLTHYVCVPHGLTLPKARMQLIQTLGRPLKTQETHDLTRAA